MRLRRIICIFLLMICSFANGATLFYWQFDEGAGQVIHNSEGSPFAELSMGNSKNVTAPDDYFEPEWDSDGFMGSCIRGKLHSENIPYDQPEDDGAGTFAKNTYIWTDTDNANLTPDGSYTIELFFNVDAYPEDAAWNHDHPLGMLGCWDKETIATYPGYHCEVRYVLRTCVRLVNGQLHKIVEYYVRHGESTFSTITLDMDAAGMSIIPGRWYYVSVRFDDMTGLVRLMVCDAVTGRRVSKEQIIDTVYPLNPDHSPFFIVASEGVDGRNFDGRIDEVRISDTALQDSEMLWYDLEFEDWGYFAADINKDRYVNLLDLAMLCDAWMKCTDPENLVCENLN